MQKKLKKLAYILSVAVIGVTLGLALQFVKAWTEPAVAPPGGNVGAPINTSAVTQTKEGVLRVRNNYIQAYNDGGYTGLLNYGNYGGYFYGFGGVYSQNTAGYYTFLDYPGTYWGVWTNGNVGANDYYVASIGRWVSQGHIANNCHWTATAQNYQQVFCGADEYVNGDWMDEGGGGHANYCCKF